MDQNRYAVGVDVGTGSVRVVMLAVPAGGTDEGAPLTIIGVGQQPSEGLRKGVVTDVNLAARSIDRAVAEAEQVSGNNVDAATVSINGTNITGMQSHGTVTVSQDTPIGEAEINRVVQAATQVKLQSNYEIIDVTPHLFSVDGQEGVRDPIDMTGIRFETDVYMVTAQTPYIKSLDLVTERADVHPIKSYVPAGMAAALVALTNKQKENGVVAIDIGYATTNIAVYEEGDIVDIKVIPVGSQNITADLATGLRCDLDVAEQIKIKHAVASPDLRRGGEKTVSVSTGEGAPRQTYQTKIIDEIVASRVDELLEQVNKELKRIHRANNLPGGAVLTGGGANLRGIDDFAREVLGLNTKVYRPHGYHGIADKVNDPAWATALGLAQLSIEGGTWTENAEPSRGGLSGLFAKIGGLFGGH